MRSLMWDLSGEFKNDRAWKKISRLWIPFHWPGAFGGPKNYKLDTVVNALGCTLENHHRAVDDAEATAAVFLKFVERLKRPK